MKTGAETLPPADVKPLERAEAFGAIAENAIVTEGLYNRHSCGTLGRQGKQRSNAIETTCNINFSPQ